ncbi:hypothetical protein D3C86_831340 [compost metagenome]
MVGVVRRLDLLGSEAGGFGWGGDRHHFPAVLGIHGVEDLRRGGRFFAFGLGRGEGDDFNFVGVVLQGRILSMNRNAFRGTPP